jgi:hypothetical protein
MFLADNTALNTRAATDVEGRKKAVIKDEIGYTFFDLFEQGLQEPIIKPTVDRNFSQLVVVYLVFGVCVEIGIAVFRLFWVMYGFPGDADRLFMAKQVENIRKLIGVCKIIDLFLR